MYPDWMKGLLIVGLVLWIGGSAITKGGSTASEINLHDFLVNIVGSLTILLGLYMLGRRFFFPSNGARPPKEKTPENWWSQD